MAKSMAQMMDELQDPIAQDKMARYQNARDAVSWAYKMAQEEAIKSKWDAADLYTEYVTQIARKLMPQIQADLNRTLEVLNESKS